MQDHDSAVFATLTYDEEHKPLTLSKDDLSNYIKKIHKTSRDKLRVFASGEYGEITNRPHYHAIIYGASQLQASRLEEAWTKGHVRIDQATPANIAYTAGYCSKKIGYRRYTHERVDPTTGEVYTWQPPFIKMSRNPGIGANAKKYFEKARLYAVKDGHKMPVPRYYKKHYRDNIATPEDMEKLQKAIDDLHLHAPTLAELHAGEKIAIAQQKQQGEKRKL